MQVLFRDYGEGLVEWGYSYRNELFYSGKRQTGPKAAIEVIRERAARRAKTQVRRWIMSQRLDYMLTLTYRENVEDRERAVADLSKFVELVRRHHKGDWPWLAVPERQKRGAWHFHIAVGGWQNVDLLRSIWGGIVGGGNIDVRTPRVGKRPRYGRLALAYYLSKYMTKDAGETEPGDHRYYRGREAVMVEPIRIILDKFSGVGVWIREIVESSGLLIRQEIATEYGGWGATWESPYRRSRLQVAVL